MCRLVILLLIVATAYCAAQSFYVYKRKAPSSFGAMYAAKFSLFIENPQVRKV